MKTLHIRWVACTLALLLSACASTTEQSGVSSRAPTTSSSVTVYGTVDAGIGHVQH